MILTATSTFRRENRGGRPRPRRGRKGKRQGIQGSPMANSESLKDKAWGKYLICRQMGLWANKCPSDRSKSPKIACYKYHQLGLWVELCPQETRASRSSTKPSFMMVNRTEAAHSSQATCHRQLSQGWSQVCNWMWQKPWTKPWEGLSEDPLTNPEEILYTDGSSFVLDGKKKSWICSNLQFWGHRD